MLQSAFTAQTLILMHIITLFLPKEVAMSLYQLRAAFDEWMVPVYVPAPFIPVCGEGCACGISRGKEA